MRMSRRGALHSGNGKPVEITYTGEYTDRIITHDGKPWRLLTFISSGVLKPDREFEALVWLCDGGMKGGRERVANYGRVETTGSNGGRGAKFLPETRVTIDASEHVVEIGAGNSGETKIDNIKATTDGSGGGRGYHNDLSGYPHETYATYNTIGGKVSTVPFGDAENFWPHCPGGGGGGIYFGEYKNYDSDWNVTSVDPASWHKGGDGGSDGSDGDTKTPETNKYTDAYGRGGEKGGGDGGYGTESFNYANSGSGKDGTAYGAAGGGCATNAIQPDGYTYRNWSYSGKHGNGCQGVMYMLMPAA